MAKADNIDFIPGNVLLNFFHHHKTHLSSMENPEWFVRRLQDSDLISKELNRKATAEELYDELENIERNKNNLIHRFWKCVFEKHIIEKYPTLKALEEKLYEKAGFRMKSELERERAVTSTGSVSRPVPTVPAQEPMPPGPPVPVPMPPGPPEPVREEQPGSSSDVTPRRGPSSLPKTTEGKMYPVTCGNRKGMLDPNLLERGNGKEKCIQVDQEWYTPPAFERLGGKSKGWRTNIHYNNLSLSKYNLKNGCLRKKPKRKRKNVL